MNLWEETFLLVTQLKILWKSTFQLLTSKIYSLIVSHLSFPKFVTDKEFVTLMKLMLTKNPINRLLKFDLIRQNLWFAQFDWEKLSNLSMDPPHFPKIKKQDYTEIGTFLDYVKVSGYIK